MYVYLNDLFIHKNTDYDLRDKHKVEQPKYNTKIFDYRSFMYYGSKMWNYLPIDVKCSNSIQEFRAKITKWCFTISPHDFDIFLTYLSRIYALQMCYSVMYQSITLS